MKRIFKYIFSSVLILLSATHLFAGYYEGSIVVRTNQAKEVNDTLYLSIDIKIDRHCVVDYSAMRLVPKIVSEHNTEFLPDIVIQGNNKRKTYERWLKSLNHKERETYSAPAMLVRTSSEADTVLNYNVKLPYQLWMDNATLAIDQEMIGYNDSRSLVVFALDKQIELTPRKPYNVQPQVVFIEPPAEKTKLRSEYGEAFIDFKVGQSNIDPNFQRNPMELGKLHEVISKITDNEDIAIDNMHIKGYASPEGSHASNNRLSRNRAYSLKEYIVERHYMPFESDDIDVSWVAEDWEGLAKLVEKSDLIPKTQILEIINSPIDYDLREARLKLMDNGLIFRTMLQEMFPKLRRVEYRINYTVKDYTLDESRRIVGDNPKLLSHKELYLTAKSYGSQSEECRKILLEVIPAHFPNDSVAILNAAAQMILQGEIMTAKRYLSKYREIPEVWNNLGVIHLLDNDLDEAERLFKNALELGHEEAKHNLKELEKKRTNNIQMERYRSN